MEKIRVSVVIESAADAELYNYLVNIPSRRRATLIRTFATQGMNNEGQLKVIKVEDKPVVNSTAQAEKETRPATETKDESGNIDNGNEDEKESALNRALGDLAFD